MSPMTFRNSKIVYYGPHSCDNCGVTIVKMGREWGGTAFTNPEGPIYPNTEWHPHVCDPAIAKAHPFACNIPQAPAPVGPKGSVYFGDDGHIVGVSDGTKILRVA